MTGTANGSLRIIRGRGYRFVTPVEVQAPAPSAPPAPVVHAPTMETEDYTSPSPPLPAASLPASDPISPATPYADGEHKLVTILCGTLAEASALATHLDRLPPEEKRLLQTAAVIGPEVPVPLLQAIAEIPEATLHRGLAHVQAAEFLSEVRLFPVQVYTFKHALTHEVTYSSLLQARRRALHARIIEVLAALSPERLAGEEAVQPAEVVEHPYSIAIALMWVGVLYCRQGALHQAIAVLERGLTFCQTVHVPMFFPLIASVLGVAYALAGRAPEALPLLEQALHRVTTERHMFAHALVLTELSETLLLVGHVEEASTLAGRLLDLSLPLIGRGYQAAAHYRQAFALAEELGMRPLQAHCHLGLGTLYAITGQQQQARVELSTAVEMYHAMAMTLWLPQAEAALAQIGEAARPVGGVP